MASGEGVDEPLGSGPPLGLSGSIHFEQVDPQTFVTGEGGGILARPAPPSVVAQIEGADAGAFTVEGLETVHLVRDPDAPRPTRVWETLATVDGSGPISLAGAQALGVTVGFGTPVRPTQASFSAVAVLVPEGGGAPVMEVPIDATVNTVGRIRIVTVPSPGFDQGFVPGQTADLAFELESTLDHDVSGSFGRVSGDGLPFSSPQVSAKVPSGGAQPVSVSVVCQAGTPFGRFDGVGFAFVSGDAGGSAGVEVTLEVFQPRSVVVTTNLPEFLVLDPAKPTLGTITAADSGGLSDIAPRAAVLPDGVLVSIGPTRTVAGGQGPDTDRTEEADITISVAAGAAAGPRHTPLVVAWTVPADGTHPELGGSLQFDVDVLAQRGGTGVDGSITWGLANPLGIQVNVQQDGWNAGRMHDLISLPSGALLAGLNFGGVWTVTPQGQAISHSDDWDNPDVFCLARGLDDPNHFYAGCGSGGALYESDPSSAVFGFLAWHQVAIADSSGNALDAGNVLRIAVIAANRKLVIACGGGVFWAQIPDIGGTYDFKQATSLPAGVYSGAAAGPDGSVVVGAWGDDKNPHGIYFGDWSSGELVFERMAVPGEATLHWISLASCASDLNRMYAAGSDAQGKLLTVLRHDHTQDGMGWQVCDMTVADAPGGRDLPAGCGDSTYGGWIKLLNVAPGNPDTVVINWARTFINFSGGRQPWIAVDQVPGDGDWTRNDAWKAHMHEDGHATVFDATDENTLYIATDGGVGMTPDLGKTYVSKYNEHLATLLVDSQPSRESGGTLAVGPVGLVAGSLQDNGDVFCQLGQADMPWQRLAGGDGIRVRFLPVGQRVIWYINDNIGVHESRWNGSTFVEGAVIPRDDDGPNSKGLSSPTMEVVDAPLFRDAANQLMVAVGCAAGSAEIYGLFSDDSGANAFWHQIGILPPFAQGSVTALGSLHGDSIWIGLSQGEIFSMGTKSGSTQQFTTINASTPGEVDRFVIVSDELAYALYNNPSAGLGRVLQLNFFDWDPLGSNDNVAAGTGLPTNEGVFYAMTIDRMAVPHTLFVATNPNVYVSRDDAQTWQLAVNGLPRMPHCADLRIDPGDGTARFVSLGTFGRSVWRAALSAH